jgi:hypothetical protein
LIIHTFDDSYSDLDDLINKLGRNPSKVVCVEHTHTHSFGTTDFVGWDVIPDVIYVDGHMPGGWKPIFDWLYENSKLLVKPLLIEPNSNDMRSIIEMEQRVDLLKYAGLQVFSSYDEYVQVTGNRFLVERVSIYDYPVYSMTLDFARAYAQQQLGAKLPITRELYDAIQTEWYADRLLNPCVRLFDEVGIAFNGSSIKLVEPNVELVAPDRCDVALHHSHNQNSEFSKPVDDAHDAIGEALLKSHHVDLELPITTGVERQSKVACLAAYVVGPDELNKYVDIIQHLIGYDIEVALIATSKRIGGVMGHKDEYHYTAYIFSETEDSAFRNFNHWWTIISKHTNFLIWRRPQIDFAFAADCESFESAFKSNDCIIRSKRSF